jgi:hypothetical protein
MKHASLETAKRLREAGWPQNVSEKYLCAFVGECRHLLPEPTIHCDHVAAPDVSDLLEALPYGYLYKTDHGSYRAMFKDPDNVSKVDVPATELHSSPAEALASLWLELKSKNLL